MSLPVEPTSSKRLRIISLDGGPSTPMMLRIIKRLEGEFPGFVERTDMFSGTSDGAFTSLFLARNLDGRRSGKEVIDDCIHFEEKITYTFKLTLTSLLRIGFLGLFSMFDGTELFNVLHHGLGDDRIKHLHKKVSIEAYNAWARQTETFNQMNAPDMLLTDAALASSAFLPVVPSFRRVSADKALNERVEQADLNNPDSVKSADLMLDGAFANNSPILPAISNALSFLRSEEGQGALEDEPATAADDSLRRISLLSMGCNVDRAKLMQRFFSIRWPPFGLQKHANLFQYGPLWTLLSGVQGLASTMIQRQATDECFFAMQLLGRQRFRRFAPSDAGALTALELMLDPAGFLRHAQSQAEEAWRGQEGENLRLWVRNFWMKDPPLSLDRSVK